MKEVTANELINYLVNEGAIDKEYTISDLEEALEEIKSKGDES